jgi:hypothetical protein
MDRDKRLACRALRAGIPFDFNFLPIRVYPCPSVVKFPDLFSEKPLPLSPARD